MLYRWFRLSAGQACRRWCQVSGRHQPGPPWRKPQLAGPPACVAAQLLSGRGEPLVQRPRSLLRKRSVQLLALRLQRLVQLPALFSKRLVSVFLGCAAAKVLCSQRAQAAAAPIGLRRAGQEAARSRASVRAAAPCQIRRSVCLGPRVAALGPKALEVIPSFYCQELVDSKTTGC
jgi:hypothetical protein